MILEQMSPDATISSEIVVMILDLLSTALSVALVYLIFVDGALHRLEKSRWQLAKSVFGFLLICIITLICTHFLLQMRLLLAGGLAAPRQGI